MHLGKTFLFLSLTSFLAWPLDANAYLATLNTGEVLQEGNYRLGADAQFVTAGDFSGGGVNGRFDMPLKEDIELRGVAGFGKVDFHFGGYGKWIPIPDYESQPAIGLTAGIHYGRINSISVLNIRVTPLASKTFETAESGKFTPFLGFPMGPQMVDKETIFPVQAVLGVEWDPAEMEHTRFITEVGLNVSKSFTYIAFSAIVNFDSEGGIRVD